MKWFMSLVVFLSGCVSTGDYGGPDDCEKFNSFSNDIIKIEIEKNAFVGDIRMNAVIVKAPAVVNNMQLGDLSVGDYKDNKIFFDMMQRVSKADNDEPESMFFVDNEWMDGRLCVKATYSEVKNGEIIFSYVLKKLNKNNRGQSNISN